MAVIDRVATIVAPLVDSLGLAIYDIEQAGPTLRISVQSDTEGGVSSADLTRLTRMVSSALDEADLISGSYTLEVTSPGLERKLRTVEHFRGAVGVLVKLKMEPNVVPRRLEGTLTSVDPDGESIGLRDGDGGDQIVAIADIQTARTVFEWGPAPKPGGKNNKRSKKSAGARAAKASATKQSTDSSRSAERSAG